MTNKDLKEKFKAAGIKHPASAFIEWANKKGHKVHAATISRHLANTQGITVPWALAYTWYFEQYKEDRSEES